MSMEAKTSNTGPIAVTMSPMTVDMRGPAGTFGRLDLPEIRTSPSGTIITVTDQKIQIVDMEAFLAFNKSITVDDEVILRLENGHTTIYKRFMVNATIVYNKNVTLKGMSGPKTMIKKTELDGRGFRNTIVAINPSPLEIDLGTVKHEIRNIKGEKIAEQKGKVYLTRGESTYFMIGETTGAAAEGDITVAGIGVEEDAWPNETIVAFNVPLKLTDELLALCNTNEKNTEAS